MSLIDQYIAGRLIDPDGNLYCSLAQVNEWIASCEIGTFRAFGYNTLPMGWLVCNGAVVSRVTYARLFAKIGTIWGSGDGSTTFKLPDLINRVIRGDTAGGTYEEDAIQNITGQFGAAGAVAVGYGNGAFYASGSTAPIAAAQGGTLMQIYMNFDASRMVRTGNETRVKSARVIIAIRYA